MKTEWLGFAGVVITGILGYFGLRYKTKKDAEPKVKDPVQTMLDQINLDREADRKDREGFRQRVIDAETKAEAASQKVNDMAKLLDEKDERIEAQAHEIQAINKKYDSLLKRFNELKGKYETSQNIL